MTRTEFLEELRLALQGNISQAGVNENLRYYENYIIEESRKGQTEEEVIQRLGNPRLIAKTIIDTSSQAGNAYDESYYERQTQDETAKTPWKHRILMILSGLVFILILIFVAKLMIFLLPVVLVIGVAVLIVQLILNMRR